MIDLAVIILALAGGVLLSAWYIAISRQAEYGRCASCGYPLLGLPTSLCPECGCDSATFRPRRPWWLLIVSIGLFASSAVTLAWSITTALEARRPLPSGSATIECFPDFEWNYGSGPVPPQLYPATGDHPVDREARDECEERKQWQEHGGAADDRGH